jgi:FMN phosphatase YigB (HAD superfamily)
LLDRYQIDPAQSIFIDDVPRNILGAQAVGIPGIHFQSPSQLNLDLQKLGVL